MSLIMIAKMKVYFLLPQGYSGDPGNSQVVIQQQNAPISVPMSAMWSLLHLESYDSIL